MPWEVHSRKRLIKPAPPSDSFYDILSASSSRVVYGAEEQWPPFYRYDYDLESLWWILLWACLFCVSSDREDSAHDFGFRIFTYTSQPSMDRTDVMQTPNNAQIQQFVPPQLVRFIHALHISLYRSYATAPNNVNAIWKGFITNSDMVWMKCSSVSMGWVTSNFVISSEQVARMKYADGVK